MLILSLYITGNVDYRDFLKSFSSNQFVKQGSTGGDGRQSAVFDRRPGTQMSQVLFLMIIVSGP